MKNSLSSLLAGMVVENLESQRALLGKSVCAKAIAKRGDRERERDIERERN